MRQTRRRHLHGRRSRVRRQDQQRRVAARSVPSGGGRVAEGAASVRRTRWRVRSPRGRSREANFVRPAAAREPGRQPRARGSRVHGGRADGDVQVARRRTLLGRRRDERGDVRAQTARQTRSGGGADARPQDHLGRAHVGRGVLRRRPARPRASDARAHAGVVRALRGRLVTRGDAGAERRDVAPRRRIAAHRRRAVQRVVSSRRLRRASRTPDRGSALRPAEHPGVRPRQPVRRGGVRRRGGDSTGAVHADDHSRGRGRVRDDVRVPNVHRGPRRGRRAVLRRVRRRDDRHARGDPSRFTPDGDRARRSNHATGFRGREPRRRLFSLGDGSRRRRRRAHPRDRAHARFRGIVRRRNVAVRDAVPGERERHARRGVSDDVYLAFAVRRRRFASSRDVRPARRRSRSRRRRRSPVLHRQVRGSRRDGDGVSARGRVPSRQRQTRREPRAAPRVRRREQRRRVTRPVPGDGFRRRRRHHHRAHQTRDVSRRPGVLRRGRARVQSRAASKRRDGDGDARGVAERVVRTASRRRRESHGVLRGANVPPSHGAVSGGEHVRGVFERAAGGGRGGVRHRVLSAETLLRGVDVPRAGLQRITLRRRRDDAHLRPTRAGRAHRAAGHHRRRHRGRTARHRVTRARRRSRVFGRQRHPPGRRHRHRVHLRGGRGRRHRHPRGLAVGRRVRPRDHQRVVAARADVPGSGRDRGRPRGWTRGVVRGVGLVRLVVSVSGGLVLARRRRRDERVHARRDPRVGSREDARRDHHAGVHAAPDRRRVSLLHASIRASRRFGFIFRTRDERSNRRPT